MDEVERAKEEAKRILRSIRTLEDLKNNKDEVMATQEKIFISALDELRAFFEATLSMSQDEKQAGMVKFSDDNFIMDAEIDTELARLNEIPGGIEYMESVLPEMEARINPHLDEIMKLMEKLMADLMGGMAQTVEGMAAAMAQGMEDLIPDQEPAVFEVTREVKDTIPTIATFFHDTSLEALKEYKDSILDTMEGMFREDLENITIMKEMDFPVDEIKDKADHIGKRRTFAIDETIKFLDVVAANSGEQAYIGSVKEEIRSRMEPMVQKIDGLMLEYS